MTTGFKESIKKIKIGKKYRIVYKRRKIFGGFKYKTIYAKLRKINLTDKYLAFEEDGYETSIYIYKEDIMKIDLIANEAEEFAKDIEIDSSKKGFQKDGGK